MQLERQPQSEIDIRTVVKRFIVEQFPSARRERLEDSTLLLENGIIDSLGVLDIVAFIESEFIGVVNDDDLIPENFGSVERLTKYIARRLQHRP